jgi:predicted RNA-binding Zn ribbon-like protein
VASYEVDGLIIPVIVTNHPALNFCNTRAGWGAPTPKEYLKTYAHLVLWSRENGLLSAEAAAHLRPLPTGGPVLARALALRSALYAVLLGADRSADWTTVNAEVRAAAAVAHLTPTRPAAWALPPKPTVDTPLWAVAWAAGELLTSPAAAQAAACPGQGCGWIFADPRGRRRWCSMAWCGNRNKARRHAARVAHHADDADDAGDAGQDGVGRRRT